MADAFVFDAVRTARGRGRPDGALHEVSALALAVQNLPRVDFDPREADVAAIDVAGFPSWTGGPLCCADNMGLKRLISRAGELWGNMRTQGCSVPVLLRERAEANGSFY
jgi:hypothetical protein